MRQPYRIESITLRDIGVFENTRFDFPPIESLEADEKKAEIHIFTGPNGCGKSTLLYALAGIFDINSQYPLIRRRYRSEKSIVDFNFSGAAGRYGVVRPSGNSSDYGSCIQLTTHDGHFFDHGSGWNDYIAKNNQYLNHTEKYTSKKI